MNTIAFLPRSAHEHRASVTQEGRRKPLLLALHDLQDDGQATRLAREFRRLRIAVVRFLLGARARARYLHRAITTTCGRRAPRARRRRRHARAGPDEESDPDDAARRPSDERAAS